MGFGENGAVISGRNDNTNAEGQATSIHIFADGPRSLTGLFRWITLGLRAYMIVELLTLIAIVFLIWLYLPTTIVPFDLATLEQIDTLIGFITLTQLVLFWACAIVVGRCTYRAMRNLYTIGSKHAEMAPGWTVGWYFIPIASLFKPAEGMSQIVHGTRHAIGNLKSTHSGIPLWWTCWILTNITQTISGQIVRVAGIEIDPFTQIIAFAFETASSIFGILSAWALMRVLGPVVRDQEQLKHGGIAHVFD